MLIDATDTDAQPDREEGFRALFKGGPARIVRSSPQFAFTLMSYEMFKKLVRGEAIPLVIYYWLKGNVISRCP